VKHTKPSNCFRRLEKLVLPSIFDTNHSSLMTWNLQSYPTTVLNERMWHFTGSNILWPLLYIFRGQNSPTPGATPLLDSRLFIKLTEGRCRSASTNAARNIVTFGREESQNTQLFRLRSSVEQAGKRLHWYEYGVRGCGVLQLRRRWSDHRQYGVTRGRAGPDQLAVSDNNNVGNAQTCATLTAQ